MKLAAYTDLIKQMPYKEHVYKETHKTTWQPFIEVNESFGRFCDEVFEGNKGMAIISRGDVFTVVKDDPLKAIFSTILWGYPDGYTLRISMHTRFPQFLNLAERLSEWLSFEKRINKDEFLEKLETFKGIGLSTFSKLLYFFNVKIDGYRCLIMDARIISVLNSGRFIELQLLTGIGEYNKRLFYPKYLKLCTKLSENNGYKPDQLEMFLFIFGNNLKGGNMSDCELSVSKSL